MGQPTLAYGVIAHTRGNGASFGAIEGKSARVEFDTSARQGETLPEPADLLVAAFAACVLKNVERFSGLQPFVYESASVEVTAEREDRPPRIAQIRYRLAVVSDEPPRRLEMLHRNIARYGTVFNTLASACPYTAAPILVGAGRRARPIPNPDA